MVTGKFGETFLLRTTAKAGKTCVRNLKETETYQSDEKLVGSHSKEGDPEK